MKSKAEKMYACFAVAEGPGPLPLDMLRYDVCFPLESVDGLGWGEGRHRVALQQWSDVPGGRWTPERWASFGWQLTEGPNRVWAIYTRNEGS